MNHGKSEISKIKKMAAFEFKISIFLVFFVVWVVKKKIQKTSDFEIRGSCDKSTSVEDLLQISSQSVN